MAITRALRRKGYDVMTAQQDGAARMPDSDLLDRVFALGRLLFSQDEDFLAEVARRQRLGLPHATVIYAHQFETIGGCIRDLEIILAAVSPEESRNHLLRVPL
jgi:hypothetical protein